MLPCEDSGSHNQTWEGNILGQVIVQIRPFSHAAHNGQCPISTTMFNVLQTAHPLGNG